jgi:hypothetical protein
MSEEPAYDKTALSVIAELFTEAESAIKYIEDFGENLLVPAVNQLRYTGNHLIRYLSSPDNTEELNDATKHVKRATYDAYETAMLYHHLEYNKFQDDYRRVVVANVIANYSEIQKEIEDSRDFVRKNNGSKTRGENYKNGKEHLDRLIKNTKILNSSRDELNKLAKKDRNNFIITLIAIVIAAVGSLFAVLQYVKC